MSLLALIGLATLAAAEGGWQDWAEVYRADATNGDLFTISDDRIMVEGATVRAWIEVDHSKNPKEAGRRSVQLDEFDCKGSSRNRAYTTYDARGNVLRGSDTPSNWSMIRPDSIHEWAAAVVCKRVTMK